MDKRTGVGMMAPVMGRLHAIASGESIPLAAQNPSVSPVWAWRGRGFGMGNMMGQQMAGPPRAWGQQGFPAGGASNPLCSP